MVNQNRHALIGVFLIWIDDMVDLSHIKIIITKYLLFVCSFRIILHNNEKD